MFKCLNFEVFHELAIYSHTTFKAHLLGLLGQHIFHFCVCTSQNPYFAVPVHVAGFVFLVSEASASRVVLVAPVPEQCISHQIKIIGKLWCARSQLYRSRCVQMNIRIVLSVASFRSALLDLRFFLNRSLAASLGAAQLAPPLAA